MNRRIPRRTLLSAGPLALAACSRAADAYFGNTEPPKTQRMVLALEGEPESLDPALSVGLTDSLILSMFEGLTSLHPVSGKPMAALATHYDASWDGLRYTFYLHGHPRPMGTRLPDTRDLPAEYSRGRASAPDAIHAAWSDGKPITAHAFVYSWRRALDPASAAFHAVLLYSLRKGRDINGGKLLPDQLGVRALDDYTLQVDLEEPVPYFLELVSSRVFCAVPRHVIETAGIRWTDPGRMVSSGAFRLRSHRPYDSIVLERNPYYYDAGQVALSELTFLITRDLTTVVNEYRAGVATLVYPSVPAIMPVLRRKKDFRPRPAYASDFLAINTSTPPFDDTRVRYALNMATDKPRIADLSGAGAVPAISPVPTSDLYRTSPALPVSFDGTVYDVLSFNPKAARELLLKSGKPLPKRIEFVTWGTPEGLLSAQVLKDQWRAYLGVELIVNAMDFQTWIQTLQNGTFRHIASSGSSAYYVDPAYFLDLFTSLDGYGTHWNDPQYKAMLAEAKATPDPALRLLKLARCERCLLQAMPVLPLDHWVNAELKKPFVRGLGDNLLDRQQFKYVWIDTNWRPL